MCPSDSVQSSKNTSKNRLIKYHEIGPPCGTRLPVDLVNEQVALKTAHSENAETKRRHLRISNQ